MRKQRFSGNNRNVKNNDLLKLAVNIINVAGYIIEQVPIGPIHTFLIFFYKKYYYLSQRVLRIL